MCSSAKLGREISCLNNTNNVAVFLSEECHCTRFLSLLDRHFRHCDVLGRKNDIIDLILNVFKLVRCHSREMRKVKTNRIFVNKLTCLLNVRAERLSQSRLKKVRRRMISCDCVSPRCVDNRLYSVTCFCVVAVNDSAVMKENTVVGLCCVLNLKCKAVAVDIACVADLSAALGIEGALVRYKERIRSVFENITSDTVCYKGNYSALGLV